MGNPLKSHVVKDLVRRENPQILFLQETNLEGEENPQYTPQNKMKLNI